MNKLSRTITGGILIVGGLVLICIAFFTSLFVLIYSILILIMGLVILFNKKEDEIEGRKDLNKIKNKR